MDRIEEFTQDGKDFIYFDLSSLKANNEFIRVIDAAKEALAKYGEHSVYSITNIKNVMYDTDTKKMTAKWMQNNRPYVKYGAIIGADGIKRIMVNAVLKMSGRTNMGIFNTKEQAVEWLMEQK